MTFLEFINGNLNKHYPLDDDLTPRAVDGVLLPDSFLVDLRLIVQDTSEITADVNSFYVAAVRIYGSSITVVIGYNSGGTDIQVAAVSGISTNIDPAADVSTRTYQLESLSDIVLFGSLVIGDTQDIIKYPGNHVFTKSSAKLSPSTVYKPTNAFTGLVVDGVKLTGDVVLEAGNNVVLDVDESTNTVRISYGNPDTLVFSNATDLFNHVISVYGAPVTSINGVLPDNSGHIVLSSGNDCTQITNSADGTITVTNQCSDPCADKAALDALYTMLGTLNLNYSKLQQVYDSIASNTSMMIARLSSITQNQLTADIDVRDESGT